MKILYLHQYFNTTQMSGGTRSYEMAKRLIAAGHDVHMITTWRDASDKTDWWHEDIDGIQVHWLPVSYNNKMGFGARMRAFAKFAIKAGQKAYSIGGDIVFATSTPLTIFLPGYWAARRLKLPLVFEVRDLWPQLPIAMGALRNPLAQWLGYRLERFAYTKSDRIIALSPGMADGVAATGCPQEKITTIPNSCDIDLFYPSESGAARFREAHPELGAGQMVLYAGTFGHINGVGYLAYLAHNLKLRCPDVKFVGIGDGVEADRTRELAQELGVLNENFFMYPAISKQKLVDAFAAASISTSLFVDLPEMWANSANKFFDTLASGTAVAVNYQGWQADLIRNHVVGVVMDTDPANGATALAKLLADPSALDAAGLRARKLAETAFSRDRLGQQFVSVLESAHQNDMRRIGVPPQ